MRDPRRNPLVADTQLLDRVSLTNYDRDLATASMSGEARFADEARLARPRWIGRSSKARPRGRRPPPRLPLRRSRAVAPAPTGLPPRLPPGLRRPAAAPRPRPRLRRPRPRPRRPPCAPDPGCRGLRPAPAPPGSRHVPAAESPFGPAGPAFHRRHADGPRARLSRRRSARRAASGLPRGTASGRTGGPSRPPRCGAAARRYGPSLARRRSGPAPGPATMATPGELDGEAVGREVDVGGRGRRGGEEPALDRSQKLERRDRPWRSRRRGGVGPRREASGRRGGLRGPWAFTPKRFALDQVVQARPPSAPPRRARTRRVGTPSPSKAASAVASSTSVTGSEAKWLRETQGGGAVRREERSQTREQRRRHGRIEQPLPARERRAAVRTSGSVARSASRRARPSRSSGPPRGRRAGPRRRARRAGPRRGRRRRAARS